MEVEFHFNDFENTEALEKFVLGRFHTLKRRLDSRFQNARVTLRGLISAKNVEGHAKEFMAELEVKLPRHRPPYIVKKHGPDFRTAVAEAIHTMEILLSKDNRNRVRRRHLSAALPFKTELASPAETESAEAEVTATAQGY